MSARQMLVAGVVARLRGMLAAAVFDAPPVRAGLPHVLVEEPVLGEWGAKDWTGREGRLVVAIADAGERPVRLRALLAEVEEALPAMPVALGEGWRLAQLRLVRSRIVRGNGDRWAGTAEFLVRLWRMDS